VGERYQEQAAKSDPRLPEVVARTVPIEGAQGHRYEQGHQKDNGNGEKGQNLRE
jgi:hypothetical protein